MPILENQAMESARWTMKDHQLVVIYSRSGVGLRGLQRGGWQLAGMTAKMTKRRGKPKTQVSLSLG